VGRQGAGIGMRSVSGWRVGSARGSVCGIGAWDWRVGLIVGLIYSALGFTVLRCLFD